MKRFLALMTTLLITGTTASARSTIEWWQFWTDPGIKPTVDSLVTAFEQANPDIDVTVTDLTWANGQEKIVIALASGTGPDVLELGSDWIAQFADNGHLSDLTAELAPDSAQFSGWGMSTYGGKLYAKPWILGTRVLFANRDLLNKAGYPPDFVPATLVQFRDAAIKIGTALGKDVYGWGSNTAEKHRLYKKYLPFFWSWGAQLFTDDDKYCVISSENGINSLTFYKMIHDSIGFVADQRGVEDAFLDGKVGFVLSGDWLVKRIELEKRKFNLAAFLMPGWDFPGRSFLGGEFLAINEQSGNKAAAVKFINFITSPEAQMAFCKANRSANPSSKAAQNDPYFESDPILNVFIKQMRNSIHPPVDPNWPAYENAIEAAVEDVLFGRGLPATALRDANRKIMEARSRNAKP
ncbi:MAG: extracellular solute-binding protein [candidate division Zixibacteria bacterium]|nr:extracellular solute-binding protein [candidate division Zixibacteria bacterium]